MVAASARISVEQNANFGIVGFTQALDVNPRAVVFGNNGIIFKCIFENMSIITGTAKAIDYSRILFGQNQQCVAETIRAERKLSLMV